MLKTTAMKKIRLLTMLVFGILACGYLMGQQQNPWDLWMNPETDDFATIQRNVENYYAGIDKTAQGSGYKQWKRWEYLQHDRLTSDGKIINYAAKNFEEFQAYKDMYGSRGTMTTYGYWTSVGPDYFVDGNGWNGGIGRVNCITFHPTIANTIWVGCPSGGMWKTTNGGSSWTPLTDGMPRIGVSGIAVNYNNTDIMYLLSGDGDGGDVSSIGVMKTIDGGQTWTSTGLTWAVTDFVRAYKLLMHPTNPGILFVVSSEGIHKSINSGFSWTLVHSGAGSNYHDIEFKPGDPTIMYACAGSKFYRSTNTGDTWTQITSGVPTTASRMAIGVSPATNWYVYLFAGPSAGAGFFVGMYRSSDSGLNFGLQSNTPNILGYSSTGNDNKNQTGYDHCIAVARTDVGTLITGAINCWRSGNYGFTGSWALSSMWNNPPGADYTHADIHALEINPLNDFLYCGSDGGFFRSTDFGNNWTDLSDGLAITQTYRFAGYEPDVNLLINGTQDEGSNKWIGGSTMEHVLGADGMDCMIDNTNPDILYNCEQYGNLFKSTNGGDSYSFIAPLTDAGSWVTPCVMNVSNPLIIYEGYSDIYKSINGGASWTNIGYSGSGAMALGGTSNAARIYASVDGSNTIYMSNNDGASFSNISAGLPDESITFIAVNNDNSSDVFVTFSGYTAGQKVYQSTNAGTNWTNISGSLPNIPVNCIAFEDNNGTPNDAVYVGTDVGVYYRDDDIGDWVPFMNGLPATMVFDLEINEASNVITAATYGRSFWRSELYSDCPVWYYLTPANDPGNPNYTGFQHYEASDSVTSTRVITGGIGSDVTYKAGTLVRLQQGFHAEAGNKFKAILGPCSGTAPANQQSGPEGESKERPE
jgi:photosystem II stability/assembly factor-like uncharacterized protein